MIRLMGLAIFFFGFWFIGQNLIIHTLVWGGLAAGGCMALLLGGVAATIFGKNGIRTAGLLMIALSAVLVFASGIITILPTSVAEVMLGLLAIAYGGRMLATGEYEL
jgi:O-antigen ligase